MIALAPLSFIALATAATPATATATVGQVSFPVSCNAPAQAAFTRGVSALHSFWYTEALTQFQAAQAADRSCALAYWGEAMGNLQLLWINDDVPAAVAALARMPQAPPTPREQAGVDALMPLLTDEDPWPRRAAFAAAMERFHQQYPNDDEGKAFLALALLVQSPDDDLQRRARAAALAFEVTAHNPAHPGALHYAIHALDTPELAALALPAAQKYAATAPEAFHARHMPAHIFSRLGLWSDALRSCQSAWEVSLAWATAHHLSMDERDYHSLQWIAAIDLELGRARASEAALALFADGAQHGGALIRAWYASILPEHVRATGQWARLDALILPPVAGDADVSTPAGCHCASQTDLDRHSSTLNARRWAAAARRDAATVKRLTSAIVALRLRRASEQQKRMGETIYRRYVAELTAGDGALLAAAKGDARGAAAGWQAMAALEDRDPPSEGADDLGGAHFLAGEAWLAAGRAADAKAELERSLRRFPAHSQTFLLLGRARSTSWERSARRGSALPAPPNIGVTPTKTLRRRSKRAPG